MQGSNPVDLILQLMSMGVQRGMPMEASSGLKQFLGGHGVSQLPTGETVPRAVTSGRPNMTNVAEMPDQFQLPDNLQYGPDGWPIGTESFKAPFQGPSGGNVLPFPERPPSISRDPWFDEVGQTQSYEQELMGFLKSRGVVPDLPPEEYDSIAKAFPKEDLQQFGYLFGVDASAPIATVRKRFRDFLKNHYEQ